MNYKQIFFTSIINLIRMLFIQQSGWGKYINIIWLTVVLSTQLLGELEKCLVQGFQ